MPWREDCELAGAGVADRPRQHAPPPRIGGGYRARGPELDDERTTSSELVARRLAGARVVRGFNSIFYYTLGHDGRPAGDPERIALPVASDDTEVKAIVSALIDEIGFDVVYSGGLAEGGAGIGRRRLRTASTSV